MLGWALSFLILGIIAGLLGVTDRSATPAHVAWVLAVVFLMPVLATLIASTFRRSRL